jgi:exonuclease III
MLMLIRLLTYNIKDDAHGRKPLILQLLQNVAPDVIVLQEVGHPDTVRELAQALNFSFYFAQGNTKRNLALLSRWPIVEQASYHPWPLIHTTLLATAVEYRPGNYLHIYGAHLIANPLFVFEYWRLLEIRTILRYLRHVVANAVVPNAVVPNAVVPNAVVPNAVVPNAVVLNAVVLNAATSHLLVGDFNALAPGDPMLLHEWPLWLKAIVALQGGRVHRWALARLLAAGYLDCFRALQPKEAGFTLPTGRPNCRLDYIWAKGVWQERLRECEVVREPAGVADGASDHYGVTAVFDA